MRRISCGFLMPGAEVASHVYDHDGRILLAKGVKLTNAYINALIKKGISSIYIEDEISQDISISDVILEETRVQVSNCIKKTIKSVCTRLVNRDAINISEIKSSTSEIVSQLLENKRMIYDIIDIRSIDDYLFGHSVNVCVLSLMAGISLNYGRAQLEQLAVGALLHDIGKALVPPLILNKPGILTEKEFQEIKKHPQYSLELLRKNSSIDSVSRIIAYEHHEKYNGEGYPSGKSGKDILDMSQIVGMVDMYDAITSNRCYKEGMPPNEAYELLAGAGDSYFKYEIVLAFLSKVAAYPSGTVVELSTDQTAIVVSNVTNHPITPKVRILLEKDRSLSGPNSELDLTGQTKVVIKRVLKEHEVRRIIQFL
ncbi:MAG: hypothetical protein VR68_03690 [Peptococcaceae bacterium BRH_c4a]|nr:MAG: hypothetical protein VR68_03690 [Peptococcaceae bacterium BRH_c4a]